jgi:hypothetical protein
MVCSLPLLGFADPPSSSSSLEAAMDAFRYAVEERGDDDAEEEREEETGEVEEEQDDDDDDDDDDEQGVAVGVDGSNAEPMPRMMAGRLIRVPPGPIRDALHEMMMEAGHPRGMQQWLLDSGDDGGGGDEDDDEIRRSLGLGVQRLRRLQRVAGGDKEDDGGDEEVSGPWVVSIRAESFEWAVADLEALADDEDEIEALVVAFLASRDEWSEQEVANHARHFQRFVELLDQQQPNPRVIRSIKFEDVSFDLDDALIRPHDLDRLFGSTLPLHPTLEKIEFKNCHISEAGMELFTSSLPAASATTADDEQHHNHRTPLLPKELVLRLGINADVHVRAVAAMVGRNARVARLALSAGFHGLQPDEFRLVCGGLRSNTNLRTLTVTLFHALDDTLDLALAPESPLEVLHIEGRYVLKDGATSSLARLLQTNTTLVELLFAGQIGRASDEHRLDGIASVLETSNCTLQRFSEGTSPDLGRPRFCHHHLVATSRIGTCLRRNQWMHHVLQAWPNYCVPSQALWPAVLVNADRSPTCLYRFVRRGNLQALCDAVVEVSGVAGQGAGGDVNDGGDVDRFLRGAHKRKAQDK